MLFLKLTSTRGCRGCQFSATKCLESICLSVSCPSIAKPWKQMSLGARVQIMCQFLTCVSSWVKVFELKTCELWGWRCQIWEYAIWDKDLNNTKPQKKNPRNQMIQASLLWKEQHLKLNSYIGVGDPLYLGSTDSQRELATNWRSIECRTRTPYKPTTVTS